MSSTKTTSLASSTYLKQWSRLPEISIWIIVLAGLAWLHFFVRYSFDTNLAIWLAAGVIFFALTYYTVITRYCSDENQRYLKDLTDVLFIGILGSLAPDYGVYFFTLYILPIAGAAFALHLINSLFIATTASLFIAGNILLYANHFDSAMPLYFGTIQILSLIVLTLFIRFLALQLRQEQEQRSFFEAKLREVDQQLHDTEAIEEEMVSITTHQLNTPLSIIRGYASMLLDGDAGRLSPKQVQYLREIHNGSLRMMKLVRDLLNITHLDRDKVLAQDDQRVILNSVTEKLTTFMQEKASLKQVKLDIKVAKEPLTVNGNRLQIEQVINNLLDNAIKYSPKQTVISVKLDKEVNQRQQNALLTVSDQGIGIPQDEQPKIFQRFYRASNGRAYSSQGSGLGLYIAKRIVEDHGGSISFQSKADQGTSFMVRLPIVKPTKE